MKASKKHRLLDILAVPEACRKSLKCHYQNNPDPEPIHPADYTIV